MDRLFHQFSPSLIPSLIHALRVTFNHNPSDDRYEAEKTVNPAFSDFFAALYFGLTTLTTVGFGDIYPITPAGRVVDCPSSSASPSSPSS